MKLEWRTGEEEGEGIVTLWGISVSCPGYKQLHQKSSCDGAKKFHTKFLNFA
jgi:hypothetical protein